MSDPWAPLPGFEPRTGPRDDFQPVVDTKARDLRAFLSAEIGAVRKAEVEPAVSWVRLPDGAVAQLTKKSTDRWELAIPRGRDWFEIVEASSREEVLRKAGIAN